MAGLSHDIPSLKDLASSNPTLRRTALTTIFTHLRTRSYPLTPTQCLQLWRGFHVALYMWDSKSPIEVQNFITELAQLFPVMCEKNLPPYTRKGEDVSDEIPLAKVQTNHLEPLELNKFTATFWETVSREWAGIDSHRMDKFLLLIRSAVRELFVIVYAAQLRLCSYERGTEETDGVEVHREIIRSQLDLFGKWPLSERERKVPDGLRYHVLDVWVDENLKAQEKVGSGMGGHQEKEEGWMTRKEGFKVAVNHLMGIVQALAKDGLSKGVKKRAKDVLADAKERLEWGVGNES